MAPVMPRENHGNGSGAQRAYNLTVAAVAGQVGCLTLVVILIALFAGLWFDARLNSRPLVTVILLIASVPVTLIMMFWVVKRAVARIEPTSQPATGSELTQEDL